MHKLPPRRLAAIEVPELLQDLHKLMAVRMASRSPAATQAPEISRVCSVPMSCFVNVGDTYLVAYRTCVRCVQSLVEVVFRPTKKRKTSTDT